MDGLLQSYLLSRRRALQGMAALPAGLALARPAIAIGWQHQPQIAEANVNTFKTLYDENVSYELVPGDYHPVV